MLPVLDHIEVIRAADNPLLKASPGLMIWTIVLFFITLYILKRYVFGPVSAMIERRRADIQQSLEEADGQRERILTETERDVQLAQDRALTAVRSEVGELALAAAEKVTRRSLSDAEHRR